MVNRPRQIGTTAETAVVRAARAHGFPHAERMALHGRADAGDVRLSRHVIAQVKAGDMARNATDATIRAWLDATESQRLNAGAVFAILIVQRKGTGPANAQNWHAYTTTADFVAWLGGRAFQPNPLTTRYGATPIRLRLSDALDILAHNPRADAGP